MVLPDEKLPSLGIAPLERIYKLIDEVRSDEFSAARGVKVAHTRMRVKLAEISKLCVEARKGILAESKEDPMEKYGVDESKKDEDKTEKTAEATTPMVDMRCPKCGAELAKHGNVNICPNCGSEPFEKK